MNELLATLTPTRPLSGVPADEPHLMLFAAWFQNRKTANSNSGVFREDRLVRLTTKHEFKRNSIPKRHPYAIK